MQVSRSAFYAWEADPPAPEPGQSALEQAAIRVFTENKQTLGSRRLRLKLNQAGFRVGRYKTRRLMQALSLVARYPKRYRVTTDRRHSHAIAPNLLARDFTVSAPDTG